MRVLGAILIVIGLLVCLTIIGIPFGLILIFIGTLLVAVGSRRRTIITNVVQVSTTPGQQSVRMEEDSGHRVVPPRREPPMLDVTPTRAGEGLFRAAVEDYDRTKWQTLLKYDGDIAKVAERLHVLGQHRVDEFAKAYLAINDKSYLPIILEKVVARAREES